MNGGSVEPAPRRALVTGAGRGIGRATALALAATGVRVLGVSRTASELESLALAGAIEIHPASLADPSGCAAVVAHAIERMGGVDILVHSAGVDTHRERAIWLQDAEVWQDTMAVNAHAAFELARLLTGGMVERGWGRIVMVSSTAGECGGPESSAYCAAKHAVVGLVRAIAQDVAPRGVTCNAVLPGWVRGTGMSDRTAQLASARDGVSVEEFWARLEAGSVAGRVVRPEEVADAISYLASEGAGAINGEAVRIALGELWCSSESTVLGAMLLDLSQPSGMRGPVDIFVRDGEIERIEPAAAAEPRGEAIDARGLLAMPGLVNAHVHSSGAFNRGLVDNLPLELFMLYELPPLDFGPFAPELYRARVLFGSLEMLRSGVTSILDDPIYAPEPSPETIAAVMGAYDQLGVRATVTIYQPEKVEYEWFPYVAELLDDDVRSALWAQRPPDAAATLAVYRDFIESWHEAAGGRLRCGISPSAPQRASAAYLTAMHGLAVEHDLPYVLHLYESKVQRVAGELLYGGSLARLIRDLGVLDERSCIVHAVWVDEADIRDLAECGASVVHSPSGNLRCGSGQMPYRAMLDAGVPLALCTDEATVEDTNNLWNVARLAALLHKNAGPDFDSWPTAREILDALTIGGARAMRLEGQVGVLAPGARADLVLLDLSSPVYMPLVDLPNHLVYGEDGRSVRLVMVDGRVVVRDGRVLTIDEDALLAEVRELMPAWLRALEPAGAWAKRLRPAFEEMYRRCAAAEVGFTRWTDNPYGSRPRSGSE